MPAQFHNLQGAKVGMAFTGLEQSLVGGVDERACSLDENAPLATVDAADEEMTEQEAASISSILVIGNGCRLCHELYRETLQATSMLGIACDVKHVTDVQEAKQYNITRNPALMVNGVVLCAALRLRSNDLAKLMTAFVKHGKTMC